MSTFFTSNTNFGDSDACIKYGRKFDTVNAMDSFLISKWNSVVTTNDVVYVLGGFGNFEIIPSLAGRIVLIEGSAERSYFKNLGFYGYDSPTHFLASKYGIAYAPYLHIDVSETIPNETINTLILRENISSNPLDPNDSFKLYGDAKSRNILTPDGLNVAIDVHNFKPISMDSVAFYIKGASINN